MSLPINEDNGESFWIGGQKAYNFMLGKNLALRVELWDDAAIFFTAEFDYISFGEVSTNFQLQIA